ncbi:hypothetical protein [Streptomyces griseorubiginosus]|uniref:hypothetical protein n=1 Tax=Streptomyces griseorubiginosus TaxID=67304 RepID=UPI002E807FB5|nr:hypothetical protein [Streptomyces griseorubiginosus]WUB42165.1 hypothetical protein OHN19_02025 [Streptomyces griseorubiginosus]WUB50684.1 hypothetical protein OG942_02020 [Streptomyces griseorubiginosus]
MVSLTFAHEPGVNDGVVTAEHLDALGPSGYLVIAGAAVDGYYTEPTPAPADAPHGLLALAPTRLLVTPHSAFHSTQAMARMAEMAVENLLAVHRGEGPPYAVSG